MKAPIASVAKLRKRKKPTISVVVVTIIDEARAGSIFKARKLIGTRTPAAAAAIILRSIAKATTTPRMGLPIQIQDTNPANPPTAKPVVQPVKNSSVAPNKAHDGKEECQNGVFFDGWLEHGNDPGNAEPRREIDA